MFPPPVFSVEACHVEAAAAAAVLSVIPAAGPSVFPAAGVCVCAAEGAGGICTPQAARISEIPAAASI